MGKYQVRVTNAFRAITSAARSSAGLVIPTDGDGYVGEISDEQLKELQADQYVKVTNEDGSEVEAPTTDETTDALSYADLKARAKELGVPANGKREDLSARVAEAEAAQESTDEETDTDTNEDGSVASEGSQQPQE